MVARLVLGTFALLALFCIAAERCRASSALDLDHVASTGGVPNDVTVPFDFLNDFNSPLSINDVTRGSFRSRFVPYDRIPDQPAYIAAGWTRFSLRARDTGLQRLLFIDPNCQEATLYRPDRSGGYTVTKFGMSVPIEARPFPSLSYPAVPVTAAMLGGQTLYIHVTCRGGISDITVSATENALIDHWVEAKGTFTWAGIYLAIAILNLVLFIYLRDRAYLAYSGVMLTQVVFVLVPFGDAWMVLWPWASVPFTSTHPFFLGLSNLTIALYARAFLRLEAYSKILDACVLGVGIFTFVYIMLLRATPLPLWLPALFRNDFWNVMSLAFGVLLLVSGMFVARRGVRSARLYVLGALGFAIGMGFTVIVFNYMPQLASFIRNLPWPFYDPARLGITWETIFFTCAIGDRIQLANAERVRALQQVTDTQEQMLERLSAQNTSMERFVPHAFLEHLGKENIEQLQLGDNVVREMSLLFSDIRSFTTLAESMSAQETFDFINSYLTHAGPIVRDHAGFIDKYIGDAIMALFPEGQNSAIDAAIALQTEVHRYNQSRRRAGGTGISVGVGLHYGTLALGTIGESARIETTVIADAVNVASRLEGLTKLYGAKIIASRSLVERIGGLDRYGIRFLGRVQVKGTSHGIEIFECFDADAPKLASRKMSTLDAFAVAIDLFSRGDFVEALVGFESIVTESPDDLAASYFVKRCKELAEFKLSDWDGIERLESK